MTTASPQDLPRTLLVVGCLAALLGTSLWVLRPFLGALVWAAMLVIATWPVLRTLEQRLGGRRGLAATLMTVALLVVLILPIWVALDTVAANASRAAELAEQLKADGLPAPPAWVRNLPLVGVRLDAFWSELARGGPEGLVARAQPYARSAVEWLLPKLGGLGITLAQLLLVVVLASILYRNGDRAAETARRFGRRLAGERGENSVVLAGQAIRGVALGVGVTALTQTALGGIGLALAGVPLAMPLTAVMLVLCIAQAGPALVLFPAVGWLYWSGQPGWGTFLLLWSLVVGTLDNVMRPVLIRRGADLPLLLVFAGVIGGMLGFGIIGIFIGPAVLAVSLRLFEAWLDDDTGGEGNAAAAAAPPEAAAPGVAGGPAC